MGLLGIEWKGSGSGHSAGRNPPLKLRVDGRSIEIGNVGSPPVPLWNLSPSSPPLSAGRPPYPEPLPSLTAADYTTLATRAADDSAHFYGKGWEIFRADFPVVAYAELAKRAAKRDGTPLDEEALADIQRRGLSNVMDGYLARMTALSRQRIDTRQLRGQQPYSEAMSISQQAAGMTIGIRVLDAKIPAQTYGATLCARLHAAEIEMKPRLVALALDHAQQLLHANQPRPAEAALTTVDQFIRRLESITKEDRKAIASLQPLLPKYDALKTSVRQSST